MSDESLPNEQAAEHMTNIAGWVCRTCKRFYGDEGGSERAARYCCEKDHACGTEGCKGRAGKSYIYCDLCIKKRDFERWAKLPEAPWADDQPLVLFDDDRFFYDMNDLYRYLSEEGLKIEEVRLVIAETVPKPNFDINEFLCDYLAADCEVDNAEEIDKYVNGWIERHAPDMWFPSKTRPPLASLKKALKELEDFEEKAEAESDRKE